MFHYITVQIASGFPTYVHLHLPFAHWPHGFMPSRILGRTGVVTS